MRRPRRLRSRLVVSHALVDAMGGRAWAESGGPGTGSTFLVVLPAA
jgi:signal transduction histidine kinase